MSKHLLSWTDFMALIRRDNREMPTRSEITSPSPRFLLANREACEVQYLNRHPRKTDEPLAALYRIYENLVLDQHIEIRNEFEAFWFRRWPVHDIPDPHDPDPERYACLASITALLCLSFNKRINLGLPRHAPAIFTGDMLEKWRSEERKLEEQPPWAAKVPPVKDTLAIPHWDKKKRNFVPLEGFDSKGTSKQFAEKNILIWQPHIHFI